jgi:hypothetical protein
MSRYNLRTRDKFDNAKYQELLAELFPSKYMKNKVNRLKENEPPSSESEYSDEETESDSEYDTEDAEEDEESEYTDEETEPVQLNITFTVKDDSSESDESEPEIDPVKSEAFIKQIDTIGAELSKEYKDLSLFQEFIKTRDVVASKYKKQTERSAKKEKAANKEKFATMLSTKPKSERKYFESLDTVQQRSLLEKLQLVRDLDGQEKPFSIQILDSEIPLEYKSMALQKLNQLNHGCDSDNGKNKAWLDEAALRKGKGANLRRIFVHIV